MILPCDDVDIHSANVGWQRSYFYTLYKEFAMELYDLFDHCKSRAVALRLVAGKSEKEKAAGKVSTFPAEEFQRHTVSENRLNRHLRQCTFSTFPP